MPIIVIFGFLLTIIVFVSFFTLSLYICFQCYNQGFPEADQTGSGGESGETAGEAMATAVDAEELSHHVQIAMEKLTKPSAEYDCEENGDKTPSELSECAICLEAFGDTVSCRVFPNCKHMFHTHCIVGWLGINQTCPICRTQL